MIAVGLVNPKTPENVGAVLRAAGCFGVALVLVSGNRGQVHARRFKTDTQATWKRVPLVCTDDLATAVPYGCVPVAVERRDDATALCDFLHPLRAFYVFGPEDGEVPTMLRRACAATVAVPSDGSLNLAAAVNIVLYDRRAKETRGRP